jgi:hypothetical protein
MNFSVLIFTKPTSLLNSAEHISLNSLYKKRHQVPGCQSSVGSFIYIKVTVYVSMLHIGEAKEYLCRTEISKGKGM